MLTAIRKLDRKSRQGALAGLALNLSDPGLSGSSDTGGFGALYQDILREIGRNLRIDPQDDSLETRARIFEVLNRELRRLALENSQIPAVRHRLGYQGYLPINEYEIRFANEFHDLCEPLGITRREALDAIKNANHVQHFLPEEFGHTTRNAVSLFLKSRNGTDPYSLVVDTFRDGAAIGVHYAVRVYHSDIDCPHAQTGVDYLEAFTRKFGFQVTVGNTASRFIIYKKVPIEPGVSRHQLVKIEHPPRHVFDSRVSFRRSGDVWEFALAYAVNVVDYARSLRSHGVRITRKDI